ncbi:MAG: hypothetical protein SFY80_14895 [Verrucomicrobiota bacterium]|nr:hypothetical protein [Verrucomicrobiota bacterium]
MNAIHRLIALFFILVASLASTSNAQAQAATGIDDFLLRGELKPEGVQFSLSFTAHVRTKNGGTLDVLAGPISLLSLPSTKEAWTLAYKDDRYVAQFTKPGDYAIKLQFLAKIERNALEESAAFTLLSAPLRKLELSGFANDAELTVANATPSERTDGVVRLWLSPESKLQLQWKTATPDKAGSAFASVDGLLLSVLAPGLVRQSHYFDYKVAQGEITTISMQIHGEGEVTRVEAPNLLNWQVVKGEGGARTLSLQFNQPQRADFSVLVNTQTPIAALPVKLAPLVVEPLQVLRYGGHLLLLNDGAVRLDVVESRGLSQISPDTFPEKPQMQKVSLSGRQAFAFRFGSAPLGLTLRADAIVPEVSISAMLLYHLDLLETRLEAEFEVDIRESPIRELTLRLPSDYSLAQLDCPFLNDSILTPGANGQQSLRLLFNKPVSAHQVIKLQLENNTPARKGEWVLPTISVDGAKSLRGYTALIVEQGLRIKPGTVKGLTEMAPQFFPRKNPRMQLAFRIADEEWSGVFPVELLESSIQTEALHLYSLGEGVAYGSSVIYYQIAGAPVSVFTVHLPARATNVEFSGKDIRNWKVLTNGDYEVALQTAVTGSYTLLVTSECSFTGQGSEVDFSGVQPLAVQSDQGYVVLVGAQQVRSEVVKASPGLIKLETNEIPADYRLLFNAPVLAAYQYGQRPVELTMKLQPYEQSASLDQVIDYAVIKTHVGDTGEIVSQIDFDLKSRNRSSFRFDLPENMRLWSITLNGSALTPIMDKKSTLIPLPANLDSAEAARISLKIAGRSKESRQLSLQAPRFDAPLSVLNWEVGMDSTDKWRLETSPLQVQSRAEPATAADERGRFLSILMKLDGTLTVLFTGCAFLVGVAASLIARRLYNLDRTIMARLTGGFAACCGIAVILLLLAFAIFTRSRGQPSVYAFSGINLENKATLDLVFSPVAAHSTVFPWLGASVVLLAGLVLLIGRSVLIQKFGFLGSCAGSFGAFALMGLGTLLLPHSMIWFSVLFGLLLGLPLIFNGLFPNGINLRKLSSKALGVMVLISALTGAAPSSEAALPVHPGAIDLKTTVSEKSAEVTVAFVWKAEKDATLPVLQTPGVLTSIKGTGKEVTLRQTTGENEAIQYVLYASRKGDFKIEFSYQTPVTNKDGIWEYQISSLPGLTYSATMTIQRSDCNVQSASGIGTERLSAPGAAETLLKLYLQPVWGITVRCAPQNRDLRRESAVYYAEARHLYRPGAGVIEGFHEITLRIPQGELRVLEIAVPDKCTVIDTQSTGLERWRFDPSTNRLQLYFMRPISGNKEVTLKTQQTAATLPYSAQVRGLEVVGASGQIGLLALGTGDDVQITQSTPGAGVTPSNVDDFPVAFHKRATAAGVEMTIRRAFRYATQPLDAIVTIETAAVQPDIRVVQSQTLSLGEDRVILVAQMAVTITRAGVFQLGFALPTGLSVESITGPAFSHWTENKTADGSIITMHLKSRIQGEQSFNLVLSGPGIGAEQHWSVPRLELRESARQTGTLMIIPEQGWRLTVQSREGLTQVDPRELNASSTDKATLAFRLLQNAWAMHLQVDLVDPWVEVELMQDFTIKNSATEVAANIAYSIKNAGLKTLLIRLPADAASVRFSGEGLVDTIRDPANPELWRIRLQRKVLGDTLLHVDYVMLHAGGALPTRYTGIQAMETNVQRGYLALRTRDRLKLEVTALEGQLQLTDWSSIPEKLLKSLGAPAPSVYRSLSGTAALAVKIERHDAAELLPAQVLGVDVETVISERGRLLTQVRCRLLPGSKRYLRMRLPEDSVCWYTFVNDKAVHPGRDGADWLVPLEANPAMSAQCVVELCYARDNSTNESNPLTLKLVGPQFDLPLENVTWTVYASEALNYGEWDGTLNPAAEERYHKFEGMNIGAYRSLEAGKKQQKFKIAEDLLSLGNDLASKGRQEEAVQALKGAYSLSKGEEAFNEDARVQLNNLRRQQALLGLSSRRSKMDAANSAYAPNGPPSLNAGNDSVQNGIVANGTISADDLGNLTPQQARQYVQSAAAGEADVLDQLADRLIKQQAAAMPSASALMTYFPEQGRIFRFTRALQVEPYMEMGLQTKARPAHESYAWVIAAGSLLAGLAGWIGVRRQ